MQDDQTQEMAKKHRASSELLMKESDRKKNALKMTNLDIEIRQLERKMGQLSVEISGKKEELRRVESRQSALESEIKKAKKGLV